MKPYGDTTPELEEWMAAHHDPNWKEPAVFRKLTLKGKARR